MTKEELIAALRSLHSSDDPEVAHGTADDLLIAFIDDEQIRDAYCEIEKWYA